LNTYSWFALQVRAGGEGLVESSLRGKDYETFLPTYPEYRRYSDRLKKFEAALFPGYIFCRFNPDRRLPILMTAGVHHIVSLDDRPTPVPEDEIQAVRRLVSATDRLRPWPYLKVGARVRVEFGAFSGIEGILLSEKGHDRLVVSVILLQRSVAVEINRTWLRAI